MSRATAAFYGACLLFTFAAAPFAAQGQTRTPLDLPAPGLTPEVFALGIVSTDVHTHCSLTLSPDQNEIYWPLQQDDRDRVYRVARRPGGGWTEPQLQQFSVAGGADCPFISPDGLSLYFQSYRRLAPGRPGDTDRSLHDRERLWRLTRTHTTAPWSEPSPVEPVNDGMLHWQSSVDAEGSIYIAAVRPGGFGEYDLHVARWVRGRLTPPELLPRTINSPFSEYTPFIAADGTYLIFTYNQNEPSIHGLRVSFRTPQGTWTEALTIPGTTATDSDGYRPAFAPHMSRDGRFLFFTRGSGGQRTDVYWMDGAVIETLRGEALGGL